MFICRFGLYWVDMPKPMLSTHSNEDFTMIKRTTVLVMLCGFSATAAASECTFAGSAPDYVFCIADEIGDLLSRVGTLEDESTRNSGALSVTFSRADFSYENGTLSFTGADGVGDTIDISSMSPGQFRLSPGGRIAVEWGDSGVDTLVHFATGSETVACTLFHNDDELPNPGFYFSSDTGNSFDYIWGEDDVNMFTIAREGSTANPFTNYEGFSILCI